VDRPAVTAESALPVMSMMVRLPGKNGRPAALLIGLDADAAAGDEDHILFVGGRSHGAVFGSCYPGRGLFKT